MSAMTDNMNPEAQIILASASPRRRDLLAQLGIRVQVVAVDIDERRKPEEPAIQYVRRLALEKARRGFDVIKNAQKLPVLGSDTIVEIDGVLLGKPDNRQHARQILLQLSGRQHMVHTAVTIVSETEAMSEISSSRVRFKELGQQEIDQYLLTGEADDKAGAYAIQGIAAQFIETLDGSFSGVMGLPLYETAMLLRRCGIDTFASRSASDR
jgi:septum formation protein